MQIRCYHCHKPFALGKEAVHAALDAMTASEMNHFNAHCPHCRRVNRISRDELLRSAPEWVADKEKEESTADSAKE